MVQDFRTLATSETLQIRSELLRKLRSFFYDCDFIEVQPPVLCSEFVIDRHIDPIEVQMPDLVSGIDKTWYLQSSPEAAMKRLLASVDLQKIFSIGPVFRFGEWGERHNPEFTMAEWYRAGDNLDDACDLLAEIVDIMLGCGKAKRQRFADAFAQFTQCDLFAANLDDFAAIANRHQLGVDRGFSDDWDDWVNLLFAEILQPKLGFDGPTLVTHFPASQAALARISKDDPRTAERFEIFYRGVELANGYCELLDADEFEYRCKLENDLRIKDGKQPLPIPTRLIAAMREGLTEMSGCALGFDRVVALAAGLESIKTTLCFPAELA